MYTDSWIWLLQNIKGPPQIAETHCLYKCHAVVDIMNTGHILCMLSHSSKSVPKTRHLITWNELTSTVDIMPGQCAEHILYFLFKATYSKQNFERSSCDILALPDKPTNIQPAVWRLFCPSCLDQLDHLFDLYMSVYLRYVCSCKCVLVGMYVVFAVGIFYYLFIINHALRLKICLISP